MILLSHCPQSRRVHCGVYTAAVPKQTPPDPPLNRTLPLFPGSPAGTVLVSLLLLPGCGGEGELNLWPPITEGDGPPKARLLCGEELEGRADCSGQGCPSACRGGARTFPPATWETARDALRRAGRAQLDLVLTQPQPGPPGGAAQFPG